MKKKLGFVFALILTLCTCFSLTGCFFDLTNGDVDNLPSSSVAATNVTIATSTDAERQQNTLIDAIAKVERSSVALHVKTSDGVSSGSGVLISAVNTETQQVITDYVYIITCHHMITSKGVINVLIPDNDFQYDNTDYIYGGVIGNSSTTPYYLFNSSYTMEKAVTLIGGDVKSDIAVLKLDLTKEALSGNTLSFSDLVTVKVAPTTYSLKRGETVFAVGNPSGSLPGSVTSGIVSYLNREADFDEIGTMELIQIDTPTNPGSSGGGLYNLYGELVGITNGGVTDTENLNFAIPAYNSLGNGFVEIAKQLIGTYTGSNYGYISGRRETLGITVTKDSDVFGNEIVVIYDVLEGSLAETEGLKANDVVKVLDINGTSTNITSYSQFTSLMQSLKFGDTIIITVSRVSNYATYQVTAEFQIKQFIFCDTGIYPEAE